MKAWPDIIKCTLQIFKDEASRQRGAGKERGRIEGGRDGGSKGREGGRKR